VVVHGFVSSPLCALKEALVGERFIHGRTVAAPVLQARGVTPWPAQRRGLGEPAESSCGASVRAISTISPLRSRRCPS
jgi:hypothetical protein